MDRTLTTVTPTTHLLGVIMARVSDSPVTTTSETTSLVQPERLV